MNPTKIVILGGGYAGIKAGKTLHKAFRKDPNVEITLIDRHRFHTLMTELHEVAGHRTEPDAITVDLKKVFRGRTVDVRFDEITSIDFEGQSLKGQQNEYPYDYLIVATGNESNFFGVEGAEEHAHTLWSYEDAVGLREHVESMYDQASRTEDPDKRKELLTFAVCGGGFTGVEMAGELGEAKEHLSRKYDIDPSEVKVYNIEAMGRILNMLEKDYQVEKVQNRYKKLGIELRLNAPIIKVEDNGFTLKSGEVIPSRTLIWAAGIKNNSFAAKLGLTAGRGGRILVNEYMQTEEYKNVFAVGDNAAYEDQDGPMPQIVQAAEASGHTAAENIIQLIQGGDLHTHKQKYDGFMVSVGSRYAVSDTRGIRFNGWLAMLVKHLVNFLYLFTVGGVRQLWNYWRHEFFRVKHRRSFVGGHFATASPNFWLVPLRVYLGIMWLIEGYNKIGEGWLEEMKMGWLLTPAPAAAADATASASQAAEAVVETVTAASGAAEAVAETASAYGEPLLEKVPGIMQWFLDTIYAQAPVFFQTMIVLTEMAVGICLVVGLFTFLSSAISVVLTIAFTLTTMTDASILWFFFGGIALIGGAGSTFGLDYYVLPRLRQWWSKTHIGGKAYLYWDELE
jgi:NADH dehydrogenase